MPAKSKSQFRLFEWLEKDPEARKKYGISKEKAAEMTAENVGKKRYGKLKEYVKKNKKKS